MHKLLYAAIGLVAGGIGGYFIARRKFNKELAAKTEVMERTYKAMKERDQAKAAEEKQEAIEKTKVAPTQQVREENAQVDVIRLAEAEERELSEFWEMISEDPSFNDSWKEYFESIEDYLVSTAVGVPPYNITEEMFSDISNHFDKVHIVIDKSSEFESAANADTNEQVFDFHDSIGDIEYDTLNPDRKIGGYWYVRNTYEDTDYCVEVITMADLVH